MILIKKSITYLLLLTLIIFAAIGLKKTYNNLKYKAFPYLKKSKDFPVSRNNIKHTSFNEINKIDKIFFINMDQSFERKKRISDFLDSLNLGIEYERFPASNGRNIEYTNLNTGEKFTYPDIKNNSMSFIDDVEIRCNHDTSITYSKLNYVTTFYKRFAGEIGVYCSHRALWKKIIDSGYDRVMILEDDVEFSPNFKNILEDFLQNTPLDTDLYYLGISPVSFQGVKFKRDIGYHKIDFDFLRADAYIVSSKAAKKLYDNSAYYNEPVDEYISNVVRSGILNSYTVWPSITKQYVVPSEIDKIGN